MPSFYINDEEWRVLFNERSDLLKVYSGIKRVMDFKTGVAGISYRMSDSFFTDLMYVEAVQGRKSERFTREKIRSTLNRLEAIGLLTRIGRNVFKLNFVTPNKSVQNNKAQTTTRTTTVTEPEQQPEKTASNVVVMGVREKAEHKHKPQQDTPRCENSNPPLTSLNNINTQPVDKSQVPDDFIPSAEIVNRAKISMVPIDLINPDQIIKFISHHKSKATLSADWDYEYLKWLMNAKVFSIKVPSKKSKESLVSFPVRVEALGKELNLPAKTGESYQDWYQRLLKEKKAL